MSQMPGPSRAGMPDPSRPAKRARRESPKSEEKEEDIYPTFGISYCGVGMDMLEDWVAALTTQNKKRIKDTLPCAGLAMQSRPVEFIFNICEKLKLAPQVKFSAVSLFDAFMCRYVRSLLSDYRKQKIKKKPWETVETKFRGQLALRLFSCVQIASKLESQSKSVRLDDFNDVMRDLGHSHTRETIMKSELRVLTTLDYRISISSPLVNVETILKILQIQYPGGFIDYLYPTCLSILEAVSLMRDELYELLLEGILGRGANYSRYQMAKLQNDYMFLACSVITTAIFIEQGIDTARWMAWTLHALTGQSFVDMTTFCGAIVQQILDQNFALNGIFLMQNCIPPDCTPVFYDQPSTSSDPYGSPFQFDPEVSRDDNGEILYFK